ncbi:MAG: sulfur carrier protein ThiS, partial [Pseudomonadota bacterium]|nr:sulfur carrier protein ThiS [Pseudomonadota bacterium]
MQITVNDKVTEVVEGLSLKQLIEDLSVDENGLALAVNQRVINRTLWPQHALHADD